MASVGVLVPHIVKQIDGARESTKEGECRRCREYGIDVKEAPAKDQTCKQQEILGPLFGAERGDDEPEGVSSSGMRGRYG